MLPFAPCHNTCIVNPYIKRHKIVILFFYVDVKAIAKKKLKMKWQIASNANIFPKQTCTFIIIRAENSQTRKSLKIPANEPKARNRAPKARDSPRGGPGAWPPGKFWKIALKLSHLGPSGTELPLIIVLYPLLFFVGIESGSRPQEHEAPWLYL